MLICFNMKRNKTKHESLEQQVLNYVKTIQWKILCKLVQNKNTKFRKC